jgi:hypothetical protein
MDDDVKQSNAIPYPIFDSNDAFMTVGPLHVLAPERTVDEVIDEAEGVAM